MTFCMGAAQRKRCSVVQVQQLFLFSPFRIAILLFFFLSAIIFDLLIFSSLNLDGHNWWDFNKSIAQICGMMHKLAGKTNFL